MNRLAKAEDATPHQRNQIVTDKEVSTESTTSGRVLSSALAKSLETLGFRPTEIALGQGFAQRHGFGAAANDCQFLVTFEGDRVTIVSHPRNASPREAAARASAGNSGPESAPGLAESLYRAGIQLDAVSPVDERAPALFDEPSRTAA